MGDQLPSKPAIESSLGHEDQDEEVFDAANRLSAAQGKPVSPAKKEAGAHERRTTTTTLPPTADLLMQDKALHTLITQHFEERARGRGIARGQTVRGLQQQLQHRLY